MKYLKNQSKGDMLFNIINGTVMTVVLFVCAYPLYYILIASISDPTYVNMGKVVFLPKGISFDGYISIFNDQKILIGYKNTLIYTLTGTMLNVCITIAGAYALSRKEIMLKKQIMIIITFTLFFKGGMIPDYILVTSLNLKDTLWAIILPKAVSVWYLIVGRSFFISTIPQELIEASEMDGCDDLRFFFLIVLPLSLSLVAVIALFYAVFQWNSFLDALLYLDTRSKHPLQLVLRDLLLVNQTGDAGMLADAKDALDRQKLANQLKFGVIVVSTLPVISIYPFLQRYFVKGVMIGSIKG